MMMLVDPIMMMVMLIMMMMVMMVFEAINKMMIVMIAHLDVDLSISLPHTSPSPFAVIKALVQEYDK